MKYDQNCFSPQCNAVTSIFVGEGKSYVGLIISYVGVSNSYVGLIICYIGVELLTPT